MAEFLSVLTAADSVRVARTRDPEAIGRLLAPEQPLEPLLEAATALREEGHGGRVTYSPTASFPLTALGRHNCEYCSFAPPRRPGVPAYMPVEQVLDQARRATAVGCREALLTLGDKPERRCPAARDELLGLGFGTTVEYLASVAGRVLRETGLLPHASPGVLGREELAMLRTVSASQGLLLERVRTRDRQPDREEASRAGLDERAGARLATIQLAGELRVPFTTGLLLDAGDTLDERAQAIAVLAELVQQEHVQALVVQRRGLGRGPYPPSGPGARTVAASGPGMEELLRTAAVVRLAAGPQANVQVGPDLDTAGSGLLLRAGVNDWGAVPPAALEDWGAVPPAALEEQSSSAGPWPQLGRLEAATRAAGCQLVARLCVYPGYVRDFDRALRWLHPGVLRHVLAASDGEGLVRQDGWWPAGRRATPASSTPASSTPASSTPAWFAPAWSGPAWFAPAPIRPDVRAVLGRAEDGRTLDEAEVELLLGARGEETQALARLADAVRREVNGDLVTYVVNGEVSYADACGSGCRRHAPGEAGWPEDPHGRPGPATLGELVERVRETVARGATEVRMHGGIRPGCTGDCHVELCSAVKGAVPEPHLHAFSPSEVRQGAATADRTVPEQLVLLKRAGLGSLPGTAAEVLDDRVRRHLCPDELTTRQWVELVAEAHRQGLPTTSTIVFGRLEGPESWARHLVVLRELQARTGGITEFVPLPFVQASRSRKGWARQGPTWEEIVKMHAVARLALRGWIDNIQVSRVQYGLDGCAELLGAGANDVGGVLMQERVPWAAGAGRGREVRPERLRELIRSVGRVPAERTTLYAIRQVFEPEER